jgi:hypothetical protein
LQALAITVESSRDDVRPRPVVQSENQARRSAALVQPLDATERSSQISRAMRSEVSGSAHTLSGSVNGGLSTSEAEDGACSLEAHTGRK